MLSPKNIQPAVSTKLRSNENRSSFVTVPVELYHHLDRQADAVEPCGTNHDREAQHLAKVSENLQHSVSHNVELGLSHSKQAFYNQANQLIWSFNQTFCQPNSVELFKDQRIHALTQGSQRCAALLGLQ